jgi:hypothetical protein
MPEVTLNYLVTNGFLFWCSNRNVTASQQIAVRYSEFSDALLMCEILEAKYPNGPQWNVALEMERQHA